MKIIISGAGAVGTYIAERLVQEKHDIVVIDSDEEIVSRLASQIDIQTVIGNASSLETLNRAGVQSADIFIAATSSDEANLITCMLADSLNEQIRIIARIKGLVTDDSGLSPRMLEIFDEFINPDLEAAHVLLNLLEVPGATEVIDFADGKARVVGVKLPEDSRVIGKKLKDLRNESPEEKILVVAISREDQLFIPRGEDSLAVGDTVYLVSETSRTDKVLEAAGVDRTPIKNVMIYGGLGSGVLLAKHLAEKDIRVKLVSRNSDCCEQIADALNGVVILNGEGTDKDLLLEEGIEDVDVFIGATEDDENNILGSLLAKKLGAKRTAVLVNNMSYAGLVDTVGVDIVVNPRTVAASSILKFVRKGSLSVFSIRDDSAEVLETVAREDSAMVGKPLKDLKLPAGAIVGAIVRENSLIVPTGESVIEAGDRVVLFFDREAVPKLEKILDAGVSFF